MNFFSGFSDEITKLAAAQLRVHPWHGIPANSGEFLNVYIEIVPTDTVKYELDKESGSLGVDRPQRFSNICPAPYGFIPQTYCGPRIGQFGGQMADMGPIAGDGDPLDVCVLTEKTITHGDILLKAIPIGGFRMIDGNEADDKIVAVMVDDLVYGEARSLKDVPKPVIDRLKHYFLTYKLVPGDENRKVNIASVYDAEEAKHVIELSKQDYSETYGG